MWTSFSHPDQDSQILHHATINNDCSSTCLIAHIQHRQNKSPPPTFWTTSTKVHQTQTSMFRSNWDSQILHHSTIDNDCNSMCLMAPIQYRQITFDLSSTHLMDYKYLSPPDANFLVPFWSRFSKLASFNNQQRLQFHAPHGTHPIPLNNLCRLLHPPYGFKVLISINNVNLPCSIPIQISNLASFNIQRQLPFNVPHCTLSIPSNNHTKRWDDNTPHPIPRQHWCIQQIEF